MHHLGDSHINPNVRIKFALTYDYPVILPIDDKCRNYLYKLQNCCSKTKEDRKELNVLFFSVVYSFYLGYYNQDIYYENYVLFNNKSVMVFNLSFTSLFLSTDYGYKRG